MINFPITLPQIDPVALSFGFIEIRWYSLAYIVGILFTMLWLKKNNQKNKIMTNKAYDDWLFWAVLSIMLGGRIGYVLFYNFSFFAKNPLEIFAFWHGGMSFHGGLLGSIFGMYIFAKKYKINYLQLTDILSVAAPVGLFFGRIANFINMELYGRVTNSEFGVIFPNAGNLPRHPSQIYEAFLEGIFLFILLFCLNQFTKIKEKIGSLSGIFLIFYGSFRILIENFREPDEQIGFLFYNVTMGQILSLPLILIGIFLIFKSCYSGKKTW
ncbi:MAG: prolipoprotein diacylglyceryl transferase [Pelagibacterales bacterium]|nr:prolipoprotein diacylglyceryl transferase [Pelagibacterales bacterium]